MNYNEILAISTRDLSKYNKKDLETLKKYYNAPTITKLAAKILKRRNQMLTGTWQERKDKLQELLKKDLLDDPVEYKGTGLVGIWIYTTVNGDKYFVKYEPNAIEQEKASDLANLLGVHAPVMLAVSPNNVQQWNAKNQLLAFKIFPSDYRKLKEIVLVGEFIPNAIPFDKVYLPESLCEEMYRQVGKLLAFDIFIGNYDRFQYIFGYGSDRANPGNLLFSTEDKNLYAIDHSVSNRRPTELYNDLFSGPPLDDKTEKLVGRGLLLIRDFQKECPDTKPIIDAALEMVQTIRDRYPEIVAIWPAAPKLPAAKN